MTKLTDLTPTCSQRRRPISTLEYEYAPSVSQVFKPEKQFLTLWCHPNVQPENHLLTQTPEAKCLHIKLLNDLSNQKSFGLLLHSLHILLLNISMTSQCAGKVRTAGIAEYLTNDFNTQTLPNRPKIYVTHYFLPYILFKISDMFNTPRTYKIYQV